MFDPNEIILASQAAHSHGQSSRDAAAAGFMVNNPDMSVASAGNASNVIDAVHANGQAMLGSLAGVKSSIDRQVAAHQAQQTTPSAGHSPGAVPDMNDLRPTDAQGFPKEDAGDFMAPFKG